MRFAKVIVDLSAQALDRTFTYSVPEDVPLSAGDMVQVPFGPRRVDGFVLSVTDSAEDAGVDLDKIKPVCARRGDVSVLLPELLELAEYMKERYCCTTADALRLMLPSQMRLGTVREKTVSAACLNMPYEEAMALCRRAPAQQKVIALLENGEKTLSELEDAVSGASNACRALAKKEIVRIYDVHVRRAPLVDDGGRSAEDPELTDDQKNVASELIASLKTGGRFLLYGVTGSGKTEVYIRLIREVLAQGRGAIILVPEIALTPQTVSWFHARFGDLSAVIHSRLSAGERYDEWQRIRRGEARVVIGARSAVFAPVENLGAIIVDEEHEGAYLSEKRPRYDARDIAVWRTEKCRGVTVLGSATPSISSFMRTLPGVKPENKLTLLELRHRVLGRKLPETVTVDMRTELEMGNKGIFSAALINAMKDCLAGGHQAMLFLNRRGHSTFVSCRACGYVVKCENCDVTMTYHQSENRLKCHYCGAVKENPTQCPSCGSKFIKYFGAGTQKIEEETKRLFPDRRVLRMDMDTTAGKDAHAKILEAFRRGEADVLVGTQMIAKGLDFANVTLVGVVAADTTLNLPDFRSAERTFQLITQVAGRAGRADSPGKVIIQTYSPDSYAIQCAVRQDYRAFYGTESSYRKRSLYPPYTSIARVRFTSPDGKIADEAAEEAKFELKKRLTEAGLMRQILSVSSGEAPIKRINGEERRQLLVKIYSVGDKAAVEAILEEISSIKRENVTAELEIDPASMF